MADTRSRTRWFSVQAAPWLRVLLACAPLLASGCGGGVEQAAPPPPEVTVAQPIEREISVDLEATGSVTGLETVEVRARVQGFVEKVHFRAGSIVAAGELLFTIDPRPFRARLAQAEAELAGKEASLQLARSNLGKAKALAKNQVLAEQELDTRTAQFDQGIADVALARANVESARLDLAYTEVRAPIGGRIGRNLVDQGALVGAGDPTLLATIVNDARVFAYFDVSERQMLDYLRSNPTARQVSDSAQPPQPVFLAMADQTGYPHQGVIDSADNQLDAETGTLRIRAVFDNPERTIVPGTFVRLRVPMGREQAGAGPGPRGRYRPGRTLRAGGGRAERGRAPRRRGRRAGRSHAPHRRRARAGPVGGRERLAARASRHGCGAAAFDRRGATRAQRPHTRRLREQACPVASSSTARSSRRWSRC